MYGRVTVGFTRQELQRVPTLMVPGAPAVGGNNDVDDLAALFYQLQHSMDVAHHAPAPLKRYPTVNHAEDLMPAVPIAAHTPGGAEGDVSGLRRVPRMQPMDPAVDNVRVAWSMNNRTCCYAHFVHPQHTVAHRESSTLPSSRVPCPRFVARQRSSG